MLDAFTSRETQIAVPFNSFIGKLNVVFSGFPPTPWRGNSSEELRGHWSRARTLRVLLFLALFPIPFSTIEQSDYSWRHGPPDDLWQTYVCILSTWPKTSFSVITLIMIQSMPVGRRRGAFIIHHQIILIIVNGIQLFPKRAFSRF